MSSQTNWITERVASLLPSVTAAAQAASSGYQSVCAWTSECNFGQLGHDQTRYICAGDGCWTSGCC